MGNPVVTKAPNIVDDCDNVFENGFYPIDNSPSNAPNGESGGALVCYSSSVIKVQMFYSNINNSLYVRRKWYNNPWAGWFKLSAQ